jgi:hypothetical protein
MYTDGRVSGRVMRRDGTPAVGVQIAAEHADQRYRVPVHFEPPTTDSLGRFSLTEVPAGELLLRVTAPRGGQLTWWPGVTDRAQAHVLRLKPNEHRPGIVIRLGALTNVR